MIETDYEKTVVLIDTCLIILHIADVLYDDDEVVDDGMVVVHKQNDFADMHR